MEWFIIFLIISGEFSMIRADCSPPIKFYIDCGITRTSSDAEQFCQSHQMTLLNLTNGTASLASDVTLLNTTFAADNCNGYFWYSSGSRSDLAADASTILDVFNILTNIVQGTLCLIPFLCPAVTTPAPITNAFTVCTRPIQQRVIQKCSSDVQRSDMLQFQFRVQSARAGILEVFPARSLTTCSGICSSSSLCTGMLFSNGTCTLYM